jgi:hypothetical protein
VASKKTVEARKPTTRAAVRAPGHADGAKRVEVQNVNHPGARRSVAAAPYLAMRRAMLEVLPRQAPGLTLVALARAIGPRLPPSIFPGGAKAGWWLKAVQLDLEAKRVIVRDGGSPLRHDARRVGSVGRAQPRRAATKPSFFSLLCSVVGFMSSAAAAPLGP